MGTSAMIGIYNKEDDSVTASYCHYDGYVDGVGRTLFDHYNAMYDAEIVAKGGYISSLEDDYLVSRKNAVHNDEATSFTCVEEYLVEGENYAGADYLYLFDGKAWFFTSTYNKLGFEEVEMNLKIQQ